MDAAGLVGRYTSLAIAPDGNPIISYQDEGNRYKYLRVAKCNNATCTNSTITTVASLGRDSGISGDSHSSIVIGVDGLPIISYYDSALKALKVLHCERSNCTVP